MSDHNKHIDRIFQESFKHFEARPSGAVWNKIQSKIQPRKKRIFPFWLKTAGIAASLLLAFGLGYWIQPNQTNQPSSITDFSEEDAKLELQTDFNSNFESSTELLNQLIDQTSYLAKNTISSESAIAYVVSSTTNPTSDLSTNLPKSNRFSNEKIASTKTTTPNLVDAFSDENENQFFNSISAIINESFQNNFHFNENNSEENKLASLVNLNEEKIQFDELLDQNELVESTEATNKWFLKPVLSPIFNAGNNASAALGEGVANNSSNGDVSFSYGMQVGYKLNNKWSIRAGINQVNTSYTTENVIYAPGASALMLGDVNSAYGLFGEDYYNTSIATNDARIFSDEGSLSQQMNFVEIPLEVEYAILDGKFGISLTGGASTFFLTGNDLIFNTDDGGINIGEAQNLNQTSFSTNIGLGINYQLSKKLRFNVEPALKYQINTFQGADLSFNPYFFGVYSGLQFQF